MSVDLILTAEQQWTLNIALRLEHAGFTAAAKHLRDSILPLRGITWEEAVAKEKLVTPSDLLRIHRGSTPPSVPAAPAPQPTILTPYIRPDQPTAS